MNYDDDFYDEEGFPEDLDPADLMDAISGDHDDRDFYDEDEEEIEDEDDEDTIEISREKHDAIINLLEVLVRSHGNLKQKIEDQDQVIEELRQKLEKS